MRVLAVVHIQRRIFSMVDGIWYGVYFVYSTWYIHIRIRCLFGVRACMGGDTMVIWNGPHCDPPRPH